jgi:hypothetical protein
MYTGHCSEPYCSNIPPWDVFADYLAHHQLERLAQLIRSHMPKH